MIEPKNIENNLIPVDLLVNNSGEEYNTVPATTTGTNWNDISGTGTPEDNATNRQIFAQNAAPAGGYKEGDLWFDSDDNNTIYRANTALAWVSVKDGTIAAKTTTFYQTGVPTSLAAGDLWFDSDDGNKCYRATSAGNDEIKAGEWVAVPDFNKTTTFAQAGIPTSLAVGDLWVDTDDNYRIYRAASVGADEIKAGEWVEVAIDWANLGDGAGTKPDNNATVGADWASNLANIPEIRGWSHDLVFSVTDADTVAWASGSIYLPTGATYAIDAGNTGNMAAKTYIYFNKAVSQTVLQVSTTASDAVGSNKILIAVAQNSTTEAIFQVFGGTSDLNIKGTSIETGSITTNEIAANTIVAGDIAAGTITSTEIGATDLVAKHILAPALFTAGEALTAGDAVYFKASDSKIYQADADADESTYNFIGFALASYDSADEDVQVITGGVVTKADWGLTPGAWYFISGTKGAVSATPGARILEVGIAITATDLLIVQRKPRQASGTATLAGTTTSTITTGFRPARVLVMATQAGTSWSSGSSDSTANECIYQYPAGGKYGVETTKAWMILKDDTQQHSGICDTFSSTGFRLNQTKAGGADVSILISWVCLG